MALPTEASDTNPLVLPVSQKKGSKKKKRFDARGKLLDDGSRKRALTKKKLKMIEKRKFSKEKKLKRASVIESLAKQTLSEKERAEFSSVADVGRKKAGNRRKTTDPIGDGHDNMDGGGKRRRIRSTLTGAGEGGSGARPADDNRLQTDSSGDSSEDEGSLGVKGQDGAEAGENGVVGEGPTADATDFPQPTDLEKTPTGAIEQKNGQSKPHEPTQEKKPPKPLNRTRIVRSALADGIKLTHIPVSRADEVQKGRNNLPIIGEEQQIVEAVLENDVVIISAETGSGKTTQVPQFLYEAGFTRLSYTKITNPGTAKTPNFAFSKKNNKKSKRGRHTVDEAVSLVKQDQDDHQSQRLLIGITEPRRVAAISMAGRVAHEMGLTSDVVSYQIRYEGNVTPRTELKFMTDGVLLKEIQLDFLLSKYSVICIDEAHERSMYSDILIGLLTRIIPLRRKRLRPLKLIIMSATLRVDDFTRPHLFREPPRQVHVESRQYPVTVYFNKTTPDTYIEEAYRKVVKMHRTLPAGGILVFVSGQQEIELLIRWLQSTFPATSRPRRVSADDDGDSAQALAPPKRVRNRRSRKGQQQQVVSLDKYSLKNLTAASHDLMSRDHVDVDAVQDHASDDSENEDNDDAEVSVIGGGSDEPLWCLPLYSLLSTADQRRVFDPPPTESRLCLIATNVAETSLTIPNISYVVDTGKVKTRKYDPVTGVSQFAVEWISQASANQRAGRAGRMGPGHCYRLYSSAVFSDFQKFAPPEISQKPVDELLLQMKAMSILKCVNFPFPSPPDRDALISGEERLFKLGALEENQLKDGGQARRISELGKTLATLPLLPTYGKILALSHQSGLLPYAVVVVACLSVRQMLVSVSSMKHKSADELKADDAFIKLLRVRKKWLGDGADALLGDFGVLMKALCSAEYALSSGACRDLGDFCFEFGIRHKALVEARKLRKQLTDIVNSTLLAQGADPLTLDPKLPPPSDAQCNLLRQIILSSLANNVAKLCQEDTEGNYVKGAYQCASGLSDLVFIHPDSALAKKKPDYIIYQHIIESGAGKKYAHNVCATELAWFAHFATPYCRIDEPCAEPEPYYDASLDCVMCHVDGSFGPHAWPFTAAPMRHPLSLAYYRWLAIFLLEGTLFPKLARFRDSLLAAPRTMVKSWAKLQRRNDAILSGLTSRNLTSKTALLALWAGEDKMFLQDQYLLWLPESLHAEVMLLWPPIDETTESVDSE